MLKHTAFFIFLLLCYGVTVSIAQDLKTPVPKTIIYDGPDYDYNSSNFTSQNRPLKSRTGVYYFGFSEGEWTLLVMLSNDSLIIQVQSGIWDDDTLEEMHWTSFFSTFNKVEVNGNYFHFGKYSGQFAEYYNGTKTEDVILLFDNPVYATSYGKDTAELGIFIAPLDTDLYNGNYSILSLQILPDSFFMNRTKKELKLMRNEIYARYGYDFRKDGEMQQYFESQKWYNPNHSDFENCLTKIELHNIETILMFERQ